MKTSLLTAVLVLVSGSHLFAQQSLNANGKTESEIFMNKPNAVIEKKMVTVGTLSVKYGMIKEDMEVNTLILRDTDTGEMRQCMVFDVMDKGKFSIIEGDEIEGFLKMLNTITDKYLNTVPSSFIELVYNTRGGTEAGCFYDEDKWVIFMRLDKDDPQSTVEMSPVAMEELKGYVTRVKEVISRSGK
jgi:hypothetical protein